LIPFIHSLFITIFRHNEVRDRFVPRGRAYRPYCQR
jgi:hypothetical protein